MKPRVLATRKILAVALTAVTGCATSASRPGPQAEIQADPAATSVPAAAPAPTAVAEVPPAERPRMDDPALFALRGELVSAGRAGALAKVGHFRPLCDADGYPLVGNLMGKGGPVPGEYQPSAFCDDVKKQTKQAQR